MDAIVRPARRSDKAPLMSFIKDVWGGHDYIPSVWEQWIGDRKNRMFVVEVGGVPVGMNRIRFLEDGSAWFEGARVHPKFRGMGLASMLGENSMKVSRALGITKFRLTSGSRNRTAHRQIARIGFEEIARFSVYEPKPTKTKGGARKVVSPKELGEAMEMAMRSQEYKLGKGVFWHDFGAASLTPEVARALAEEGAFWRLGRAVAIVREGGEGRASWEEVCFIGGPPGDALELIRSVTGRKKWASERWIFVPQRSPIIHALRMDGFERRFSNILYERGAPKG